MCLMGKINRGIGSLSIYKPNNGGKNRVMVLKELGKKLVVGLDGNQNVTKVITKDGNKAAKVSEGLSKEACQALRNYTRIF